MELNLTDYDKQKFPHLDTMKLNSWHIIKQDRPDLKDFMECLKKYNEAWKLLVIEDNRFKKVLRPESIEYCKEHGIKI